MGIIYKFFVIVWLIGAMSFGMKVPYYLSPKVGSGLADFVGIVLVLLWTAFFAYIAVKHVDKLNAKELQQA